jgi:acyl-ACP thioesterase
MKLIDSYKFNLPSSYYVNDLLKPYGYFDIFQELASKHASKLGIGFEDLSVKNITWVLARVKYEIVNKISIGISLVGHTWPHPHSRFDSIRDYLIYDDNGNLMAKGTSVWCLINFSNGRLLPTSCAPIEGDFVEDYVYETKLEKISYEECLLENYGVYRVKEDDIDCNKHMNNAKYGEVVFSKLNEDEFNSLVSIEINYLLQAYLEDEILLKGYRKDNQKFIIGYKGEHICFIAKCEMK